MNVMMMNDLLAMAVMANCPRVWTNYNGYDDELWPGDPHAHAPYFILDTMMAVMMMIIWVSNIFLVLKKQYVTSLFNIWET